MTDCYEPCRTGHSVSGTFDIAAERHTVPFDSLLGHAPDAQLWGWDRGDSLFFHVGPPNVSHGWIAVEVSRIGADSAAGLWSVSGYIEARGTIVLRRLD